MFLNRGGFFARLGVLEGGHGSLILFRKVVVLEKKMIDERLN